MKVYVDSSVLVRLVMGEDNPVQAWGNWELAISSELTNVEVMRAIERLRVLNQVTGHTFANMSRASSALLAELELVPMQPAVLRQAAAYFPKVIGTLDAIHLATALLWQEDTGEQLIFLTHDRQLRIAAQACGLA